MPEVYKLPFLSNILPSITASRNYLELLFFLETFKTASLDPNFIYYQHKSNDHFSSLGTRSDKHLEGCVQLIQQIRRNSYGLLHLHLLGNQDASFASIIIGTCFNDSYQIYISGLDKLEQKKITAQIDFNDFSRRPTDFDDDDIKDILVGLRKHFYQERFRQALYSMPFLANSDKDEIMRIAARHSSVSDLSTAGASIKTEDIKLVNAILIYEYWIKYEPIFQQIMTYLSQNKDQKKLYNARLVFSLFMAEKYLSSVKSELNKIVNFEDQDTVARIKNNNDLASFLSSFFLNSEDENLKNKVQYVVLQALFENRLNVDYKIFKKTFFISKLNNAKIALNNELVDFADEFYNAAFLSDTGLQKNDDTVYLSDAANKVFVTRFINLFMHSELKGKVNNMSPVEYTEFAKEIKNFLNSGDVFFVDNMVVNSVIQSYKNTNLIISKTLDRTKIKKSNASKILFVILNRLTPHYDKIVLLRKIAATKQKGEQTKIVETQMESYFQKSIKILPRLDYILCVQHTNNLSEEKTIFYDAKRSLGMQIFSDDYESLKNYNHKIGYSKLILPSIHDVSEMPSIDPSWLYDIYMCFIKTAVHNNLKEMLNVDLAFIKDKNFNRFDYLLHNLSMQNIFLGYHQLKDILLEYKNWNIEHLHQLGYNQAVAETYHFKNPLMDYSNWLPSDGGEKKEVAMPVFNAKFSIQDYCNYHYAIWHKAVDQLITPKKNNKRHTFLSKFFQNLINGEVFNVFSYEALNSIPYNDWYNDFKFSLQEHFKNELMNFKESPKYILVRLPVDYHFIPYLFDNFSVELGDSLIPVVFININFELPNIPGSNWHWDMFAKKIEDSKESLIYDIRFAWSRMLQYQKIYQGVINSAALIIVMDVVSRYLKPRYKKTHNITYYHQMHDSDKLIIYSGRLEEAISLLNSRQYSSSVVPISEVSEKFYEYNQAEADKIKIAKNLRDINLQLSKIPHIKYAPKNIKMFRLNIKKIEDLLSNKIVSLDENDLKILISMVYDCWNLYTQIVEQEASYPYKYRYLHIAFSNNISMFGKMQNQDMINFFRATSDFKNNKKTSRNFLLSRLYESVLFKNNLTNKKYFFICGRQLKTPELVYMLESIRIVKGMEAEILLDNMIEESAKLESLAYISPHAIISFKMPNT